MIKAGVLVSVIIEISRRCRRGVIHVLILQRQNVHLQADDMRKLPYLMKNDRHLVEVEDYGDGNFELEEEKREDQMIAGILDHHIRKNCFPLELREKQT
jgi:hypothetical protein